MLPSTSSCLRQGPTHVTDTGRCPTPCLNPIEVVQLGQLIFCCSRLGAFPSSRACSVLFPALRLSRAAVCAATKLLVCCSQDLSDLRTTSVLSPDRRGEPVVTVYSDCPQNCMSLSLSSLLNHRTLNSLVHEPPALFTVWQYPGSPRKSHECSLATSSIPNLTVCSHSVPFSLNTLVTSHVPMTVSPVTQLIRSSMALRPVPFRHLTHPLDPDLLRL